MNLRDPQCIIGTVIIEPINDGIVSSYLSLTFLHLFSSRYLSPCEKVKILIT